MAGTDDPRIECDQCGKVYKWKPDLAGKRVKCACGNKIQVPQREDPADESGTYELNFDDDHEEANTPAAPPPAEPAKPAPPNKPDAKPAKPEAKKPEPAKAPPQKSEKQPPAKAPSGKGRCPSCGNTVKAGAVICLNCGYNLQTGQKIETAVKDTPGGAGGDAAAKPEKLTGLAAAMVRQKADQDAIAADREKEETWQEVYVPLILFGAGVFLLLVNTLFITYTDSRLALLIFEGVRIVVQVPFVFIGLVLTAMIFGSSYGPIITATLKMLALVVFSTAIYAVTVGLIVLLAEGDSIFGMEHLMALLTGATAFFSLAMWLFDMDFMEAAILYILAFWAPWGVLFVGLILIGSMF